MQNTFNTLPIRLSFFESLLDALANGETSDIVPQSRMELVLKNALEGKGKEGLPEPLTTIEAELQKVAEKMKGGGSSEGYSTDSIRALFDGTATEFTLPEGLTTVRNAAFTNYATPITISIPDTVRTIEQSAFYNSDVIISKMSGGVQTIQNLACYGVFFSEPHLKLNWCNVGEASFYGNTGITDITISGGGDFSSMAFAESVSLSTVTVTKDTVFYQDPSDETSRVCTVYFNASSFSGCSQLTTINVPWPEGAVAGAPWGATKATINYNYTGE